MNISIMILAAAVTFAEGGPTFDGEPSTNAVHIETIEDFEKSGLDVVYIDTNKTTALVYQRIVCVPEREYMVLTSNFAKVWSAMHTTEDGRIRMHGMRRSQILTDTQKLTTYADGYTHAEPLRKKRVNPRQAMTNAVKRTEPIKRYSDRQSRMRESLKLFKDRKPKEVTLEHDAATGKDTVK